MQLQCCVVCVCVLVSVHTSAGVPLPVAIFAKCDKNLEFGDDSWPGIANLSNLRTCVLVSLYIHLLGLQYVQHCKLDAESRKLRIREPRRPWAVGIRAQRGRY